MVQSSEMILAQRQDHSNLASRRLKLAIFAAPLSGNKGSASMVWGLLDLLRAQGFDVDTIVYSYYPAQDSAIAADLPGIGVRPGHPKDLVPLIFKVIVSRLIGALLPGVWRCSHDELAGCEVACLMGGTTFSDAKLYKVPWNLAAALPALIVGVPVVFMSQTMGPFSRFWNRTAARWTLRRAKAVFGRGPTSTEQVRRIGIVGARYQPDLSFGMRVVSEGDSPVLDRWLEWTSKAAQESGRSLAAVTPNTIVDDAMRRTGMDYPSMLAAIVVELHARGFYPIMIPHSFRGARKGRHNNDVDLCQEALDYVPGDVPYIFVDEDLSSSGLRAMIARLDLLVASRFHSMVSALSMETPCVTLGWGGHKYLEVLSVYGLESLYIHYSDASLDAVRAKLDWVQANDAEVREKMRAGNAYNLELLQNTGDLLKELSSGR